MDRSYPGDRFGGRRRTPGGGRAGGGSGLWEAMEQFRDAFEERVGTRMGRGDVRAAILSLLAEQPMHGYQVINEIEKRSHGMWKPSPGSVYPALQLLADEGLVTAAEADGRKTYSLTEAGRAVAEDANDSAPWMMSGMGHATHGAAIPRAGSKLAQAAAQVARHGTPEQVNQAVAVLDEARRRLYSILAQD
ncbi:PadR family transcriptional regulator [Ruicaihuangia caeni]|uniref:PadR family transcriptional regulator n=1 Tax=Ruicaihuangia caeni TaxID=3042517 RepID=UPI00338FAE32